MKIKVLLPAVEFSLSQDAKDYLAEAADPDTELVYESIEWGTGSIESEYDEALACQDIFEKTEAAVQAGCDGLFVDCFGDPGVRGAREITKIPIVGGFEPAMMLAMGLGDNIGIITVLDNVVPMLWGNVHKMGIQDRVKAIDVVNMPVLELHNFDDLIDVLTAAAKKAILEKQVHVLVLGCTGMALAAELVHDNLMKDGLDVPVVDPSRAAIKVLESYIRMGLYPSKRCYMTPTEKKRNLK